MTIATISKSHPNATTTNLLSHDYFFFLKKVVYVVIFTNCSLSLLLCSRSVQLFIAMYNFPDANETLVLDLVHYMI